MHGQRTATLGQVPHFRFALVRAAWRVLDRDTHYGDRDEQYRLRGLLGQYRHRGSEAGAGLGRKSQPREIRLPVRPEP